MEGHKVVVTIIATLLTVLTYGQRGKFQPNNHNWFISAGLDTKMVLKGPHGSDAFFKLDPSDGVLNAEFRGGAEFKHTRIWMGYEFLSEINYKKFTYLAYDYKVPILYNERFSTIIGAEASVIQRKQNEVWKKGMQYTGSDENLSFGVNAEFNYWVLPELAVFVNYNVFLAEKWDNFGNEMKKVRQDVMVGAIFKFL